jgi:hypothetical protein
VASWDDVRRIALGLPEATEASRRGLGTWSVRKKTFAWERPLRKSDLAALGAAAPSGQILAARVEHEVAKAALLAENPGVFFTTPHFDGYPAILVRLDVIGVEDLEEVVVEAWLVQAPQRVAKEYLESR